MSRISFSLLGEEVGHILLNDWLPLLLKTKKDISTLPLKVYPPQKALPYRMPMNRI